MPREAHLFLVDSLIRHLIEPFQRLLKGFGSLLGTAELKCCLLKLLMWRKLSIFSFGNGRCRVFFPFDVRKS